MPLPKTVLQLAGVDLPPLATQGSALVVIDAQGWYVTGPLALPGIGPALQALSLALERARAAGVPVVHHGQRGTMFDSQGAYAAIVPEAAPLPSKPVVAKHMPSALTETRLESLLRDLKVTTPVFAGFMTRMSLRRPHRCARDLEMTCS